MRAAIVHEWLASYAGSERVLEQMLRILPEAELFALVDALRPAERAFLGHRTVTTSFLQRMPFSKKHFRAYLPWMPLAVEQFDLSAYDLVISNCHAVAKGVLTNPHQLHLCVCYSPMRYAWHLQEQYLRGSGLAGGLRGLLARRALHRLRIWDARTPNGVDAFLAISRFVARRIWKVYRRRSTVLYPPVDTEAFRPGADSGREDVYVAASRLVPYKRMELIVEAFGRMPGRRLVVIGDGPGQRRLARAAGPNVRLLGHVPQDTLRGWLQRARAFVFAAEEDFGILPVEAQACGTPVIAFGRGGATETVQDGRTGVLFAPQTPEALMAAMERFEAAGPWDRQGIRANAERFTVERFRREFQAILDRKLAAFRQGGDVEADADAP